MQADAQNRWSPLLASVLGAFSGVTLCWIAWGLMTPGDFFANGAIVLLGITLIGAAALGGYLASRIRSRALRVVLLALSSLCVAFWIVAKSGWWASPPPSMP